MEIVLAQGKNILSKLIMKSTDFSYSHCALRYSVFTTPKDLYLFFQSRPDLFEEL